MCPNNLYIICLSSFLQVMVLTEAMDLEDLQEKVELDK